MKIYIATGIGYGQTMLSAFDAALMDAGIHNFNLIQLSSIVPPGAQIISKRRLEFSSEKYGNRLYLVKAESRSRETNKFIGAALGWYQIEDGRGVFVEHEEIGETEEAVRSNLEVEVKKSLTDLCKIRNYPVSPKRMNFKINVVKVEESATCSLVVAVFKDEGWV